MVVGSIPSNLLQVGANICVSTSLEICTKSLSGEGILIDPPKRVTLLYN